METLSRLGQSMSRFTESVFIGARAGGDTRNITSSDVATDRITTGEDTSSSLALQVLLYFNVFLSIVYLAMSAACTGYKVKWVSGLTYERIVFPIIVAVWALVEGPRLWIGMKGNAREQVAKLTSFVFISFVPQLGAVAFTLFVSQYSFPVEHALSFIMMLFLLAEIVLGVLTTKRAIRSQTARFFVERYAGDTEPADEDEDGVGDGMGAGTDVPMLNLRPSNRA